MDLARLVELNATYARVIDNEQFEAWPDLFDDPCLYKVTTAENVARGFEAGIMYADSRGMLHDRVSALRKANIYERQRYRHIVGLPVVTGETEGASDVETPFLIVRIMRDGTMDVFATGCYRDKVKANGGGALRFSERIVVCDGGRFDTLVAIPF
jgi:3-phenylpropionate/cinnamic acid dioxygenase small subunit